MAQPAPQKIKQHQHAARTRNGGGQRQAAHAHERVEDAVQNDVGHDDAGGNVHGRARVLHGVERAVEQVAQAKAQHADDVKEEHARGDGGAFKVKLPAQVQRLDDVLIAHGADGDDGRHHHGDGHGGAAHDLQNAAAVIFRHHAAHAREHDRRQGHDDHARQERDDLVAVGERGHVAGIAVGGAPLIHHVV